MSSTSSDDDSDTEEMFENPSKVKKVKGWWSPAWRVMRFVWADTTMTFIMAMSMWGALTICEGSNAVVLALQPLIIFAVVGFSNFCSYMFFHKEYVGHQSPFISAIVLFGLWMKERRTGQKKYWKPRYIILILLLTGAAAVAAAAGINYAFTYQLASPPSYYGLLLQPIAPLFTDWTAWGIEILASLGLSLALVYYGMCKNKKKAFVVPGALAAYSGVMYYITGGAVNIWMALFPWFFLGAPATPWVWRFCTAKLIAYVLTFIIMAAHISIKYNSKRRKSKGL